LFVVVLAIDVEKSVDSVQGIGLCGTADTIISQTERFGKCGSMYNRDGYDSFYI